MSQSEEEFVSPAASPSLGISRVAVRIPPFWKSNPKLWFSQIESQFYNSGISQDATKYHALVGSIESDVLNAVSDVIENPPTQNMYDTLKSALLTEFQDSEEKRLQKLLENMQLGDKRPSSMLREMRQLSSGKMSDEMLKSLWFQRLPSTLKAVLSISSDSLEKLAVMADKINDQLNSSYVCPIKTTETSRIEQLESKIDEIVRCIDGIKTSREVRGRNRSSSRNRSNSRNRELSRNLCWYHFNFGSKAMKCRPPCSHQSEN